MRTGRGACWWVGLGDRPSSNGIGNVDAERLLWGRREAGGMGTARLVGVTVSNG